MLFEVCFNDMVFNQKLELGGKMVLKLLTTYQIHCGDSQRKN